MLPANKVVDLADNAMGTTSSTLTFEYDVTAPTVTLTSSNTDPTRTTPVMFTVTLSEVVRAFVVGDLSVTGATLSAFADSGDGLSYTVAASPSAQGDVTLTMASGTLTDFAGNTNPSEVTP